MRSHFFLTLCVALCTAGPAKNAPRAGLQPEVKIQNGTVAGSTTGIVDSFKGIPFAQQPVGNLRLRPPQTIDKSFGTFQAIGSPKACPQFAVSEPNTSKLPKAVAKLVDKIFATPAIQGEDCLTLNVQRPAGTTASSKLPVLFWIYGGGFEAGSTSMYDGTDVVTKSIELGKPIMFVAVNYRLGGYGFLAGKELSSEHSTNLGLRDQRKGLEWTAENIAAFGGDPSRVTIWGESAGSISVLDQLVIDGGNNLYQGKPLFRGAMMDSGSIIPAKTVTSPKAQTVYDQVVSAAGCSGKSDTLACLRSIPYPQFNEAVNSQPGIFSYQSVNLAYLPRPDPADSFFSESPEIPITSGKYVKVPLIIGDQQDEGTLFSLEQDNLTTTSDLVTYLNSYFPTEPRSLISELVALYPDNPSAGSPYNTGPLNNIYPQYKRLAAILGDITFTLARRAYLLNLPASIPKWSYIATYLYGTPILGTLHGSDILECYFDLPDPIPANAILTYYVSFVNDLEPNSLISGGLTRWPQWTSSGRHLLEFSATGTGITPDTFREKALNFLQAHRGAFRI